MHRLRSSFFVGSILVTFNLIVCMLFAVEKLKTIRVLIMIS